MSLRDRFAGKAMQGQISRGDLVDYYPDAIAKQCYEMADAMMEARNRRKEAKQ
jgi:predicted component of type VI protein secretion system